MPSEVHLTSSSCPMGAVPASYVFLSVTCMLCTMPGSKQQPLCCKLENVLCRIQIVRAVHLCMQQKPAAHVGKYLKSIICRTSVPHNEQVPIEPSTICMR